MLLDEFQTLCFLKVASARGAYFNAVNLRNLLRVRCTKPILWKKHNCSTTVTTFFQSLLLSKAFDLLLWSVEGAVPGWLRKVAHLRRYAELLDPRLGHMRRGHADVGCRGPHV